jgi:TENA/THI-4/PQQC family
MSKLVSRLLPTLVREMDQSITSIPLILYHLHRTLLYLIPEQDADLNFRGRFIEYLLERPDVKGAWKEHTHHDFVAGLADGTLPVEAFKYYLVQDYLYLVCGSVHRIKIQLTSRDSICKSQRLGWVQSQNDRRYCGCEIHFANFSRRRLKGYRLQRS